MERWSGSIPERPPLGFRGSFLSDGGGREWSTHGDIVVLETAEDRECRRDPKGDFERLLIESAPAGTLPPM
jgi:hypothetical protein